MMDHRSYGETHDCKGCRYWSEMLAMSDGGPVNAACLSPTSKKRLTYVAGHSTCDVWASGYDGAIDEPGANPDRYAQLDQDAP